MRLQAIKEAQVFDHETNSWPHYDLSIEAVVETLEDYVDQRNGHLTNADRTNLEKYLNRFSPAHLNRIAALLGSTQTTPVGIANEIANGQLIAYVGEHNKTIKPNDADIETAKIDNNNFQNSPPAFRGQSGQSPDLNQLDDRTRNRLDSMTPGNMIDSPNMRPAITQPFIYKGGKNARLFVGDENRYHYDLLTSISDFGLKSDYVILNNIYYDDSNDYIPGVVGRIGYNFHNIDPKLANTSLVSVYARDRSKDPNVIRAAVQALVQDGYIPPDAIFCYGGKAVSLTEILGDATQATVSDDSRLWDQLNSKYYLSNWTPEIANKFYTAGEWPNRTPMTSVERALIARKFKLGGTGGAKNQWQSEMEKAGIINPGQKWWAPTSESKNK